ncbi:hypothetical protein HDV05_006371 [Chytridiales sp. JEL 0842]|nr:hypothetical protein HDV05_006371 [Chytridiales sp. JEL 0842]
MIAFSDPEVVDLTLMTWSIQERPATALILCTLGTAGAYHMVYGAGRALRTLGFQRIAPTLKPKTWTRVQLATVGVIGLTVLNLSGYGIHRIPVPKASLWREMHEAGSGLLLQEFY